MSQIFKIAVPFACLFAANLAYADSVNHKRQAVSAGWMHVMPQGKANSTHVTTAVEEGGSYGVGSLWGADLGKYGLNGDQLDSALGNSCLAHLSKMGKKILNIKCLTA